MEQNIAQALKWLDVSEGGYGNTPGDPGGPTNHGVTQAVYNAHRRQWGLGIQSVRFITMDEVTRIYKASFWDEVKGDLLPAGLDYAVFDFGVNSGPHTAIMHLQSTLKAMGQNIPTDGVLGPLTLEAVHSVDVVQLITKYVNDRLAYMRSLKGLWWRFAGGWTHRLFGQRGDPGVLNNALSLIPKVPPPVTLTLK